MRHVIADVQVVVQAVQIHVKVDVKATVFIPALAIVLVRVQVVVWVVQVVQAVAQVVQVHVPVVPELALVVPELVGVHVMALVMVFTNYNNLWELKEIQIANSVNHWKFGRMESQKLLHL
jgi:hypothetical protein